MHRTLSVFSLLACVLLGSAARAHEIGTTRVTFVIESETYHVQIHTDAVSLLEKLESTDAPAADITALQRRLAQRESIFRQRLAIAFDGVRDEPAITWRVIPADAIGGSPTAIVGLSGHVPPLATQVTWQYGWTFSAYPLTVRHGTSTQASTTWLDGRATSDPLPLARQTRSSRARLAWQYTVIGFTHILPKGIDHVLFVLGLYLLSRRWRPVLLQVSAFTIAHSVTLALGMYRVVHVPASIVEPLIALSIAYIALENVFTVKPTPWRYVVVFAFGLLHGLGFAGALADVGLPRTDFVTALIGFNVGVELGQLAVIAGAFLLVGCWFGERTWFRRRISLPASACIALLGVYWTFERLGFRFT